MICSYSKSLSKALPDRVFRQISLGDIKPDVAKKFVVSHLDIEKSDPKDTDALTPTQKQDDVEELDDAIVGKSLLPCLSSCPDSLQLLVLSTSKTIIVPHCFV